MLSNPLRGLSGFSYDPVPSTALLPDRLAPPDHLHGAGLGGLGQDHFQQQLGAACVSRPGPQAQHRQHSHSAAARSSRHAGLARRRISRACDQCNQLRTKCDGRHPCAHCTEFGLGCEYARERKKRGKASKKDQARKAASQSCDGPAHDTSAADQTSEDRFDKSGSTRPGNAIARRQEQPCRDQSAGRTGGDPVPGVQRGGSMDALAEMGVHGQKQMSDRPGTAEGSRRLNSPASLDLDGYDGLNTAYSHQDLDANRQGFNAHLVSGTASGPYTSDHGTMAGYPEIPYALQPLQPPGAGYSSDSPGSYRMDTHAPNPYSLTGESTPPGWNSTPPASQYASRALQASIGHSQARYPVLAPLLPHLGVVIPTSLACDLLDLYFASSSSAQMHPMSPYVLGFVFRKRSFLHPTRPRQCQPALLASMLWVAAQTSDAPLLAGVPSARGKACQRLLELTVGLLRPLIHTPAADTSPTMGSMAHGVALGGLGVAVPGSISMDALAGGSGAFGAAGTLDDVATYIHLATVVSASEYKGASVRWWNAAWTLARELRLNRELDHAGSGAISQEEREERRRIWWLVYIVDRHLALCYNRPLFLLDAECAGLLQPMDDTDWQNGDFHVYAADPGVIAPNATSSRRPRRRGPSFECSGHSIFGYFLPLMTILGEVVDLHHARNHPRFGPGFRSSHEWGSQTAEVVRHLEVYDRSLKSFELRHLSGCGAEDSTESAAPRSNQGLPHDTDTPSEHSAHSAHSAHGRMTESDIQARIVLAYGTHVMHVLHILLAGKWDPIDLLDDNDLWISSQGFIAATGHAVSAAEAISIILEFDPGLEFMPFFFGIYLLQGSFLLLLIADKLQVEASLSVVRACETIIRAHEACVVTLNTEYQRNFSRVMRGALALVRGRVPEDLAEQHQRRRELLALYRWTGGGTGLAL